MYYRREIFTEKQSCIPHCVILKRQLFERVVIVQYETIRWDSRERHRDTDLEYILWTLLVKGNV